MNYFTIGTNPVGLCSETTAILVSASETSLAPLVELIRVSLMVTIYTAISTNVDGGPRYQVLQNHRPSALPPIDT